MLHFDLVIEAIVGRNTDYEHHHGAQGPGLQLCTEFTVDLREEIKSTSSYQREIQMLTDDQ